MELRSISRGRPTDTFADPVLRLRAWYWLARVQQITGTSSPIELDASRLMPQGLRGRRFQSVADDGFDPGQILVTKTCSLLDYVSKKRALRSTQRDYAHSLWHALQNRHWQPPGCATWIDRSLNALGIVLIDSRDGSRANELGLDWPDHFVREDATPVLRPLSLLVGKERLATPDGMLLLILLYRRCLDQASFGLATELMRSITLASSAFETVFHEEGVDTWRHIVRTRIHTWAPDFTPDDAAISAAEITLRNTFEATAFKKRGRAPLHPDLVSKGKVKRRWRRRALMKACATNQQPPDHIIGFQALSPFNAWLIRNRRLIDAHVNRAGYFVWVGESTDPDYEARLPKELPALEVPVNDTHTFYRPYTDAFYDYRTGEVAFDRIPMQPIKVKEK